MSIAKTRRPQGRPAAIVADPEVLELSARMRAARRSLRLSVRDVADRSGLREQHIYAIESGRGSPSWKTVKRLCAVIGLRVEIVETPEEKTEGAAGE